MLLKSWSWLLSDNFSDTYISLGRGTSKKLSVGFRHKEEEDSANCSQAVIFWPPASSMNHCLEIAICIGDNLVCKTLTSKVGIFPKRTDFTNHKVNKQTKQNNKPHKPRNVIYNDNRSCPSVGRQRWSHFRLCNNHVCNQSQTPKSFGFCYFCYSSAFQQVWPFLFSWLDILKFVEFSNIKYFEVVWTKLWSCYLPIDRYCTVKLKKQHLWTKDRAKYACLH